jgi:MFS family permease
MPPKRGQQQLQDGQQRPLLPAAATTADPRHPPPPGAALCDALLFGALPGVPSAAPRRGSVWLLAPTQLIPTIAYCILSPIIPQLKQQYFGSGHAAADVSGWTDSIGYWGGFVIAAILGRISDCHGRRSIIILQSFFGLLGFAALAFREQLGGNLWFYIWVTVIQKVVSGGGAVSSAYLADLYLVS